MSHIYIPVLYLLYILIPSLFGLSIAEGKEISEPLIGRYRNILKGKRGSQISPKKSNNNNEQID